MTLGMSRLSCTSWLPLLFLSVAACFSGDDSERSGDKQDVFGWDDRREVFSFRDGSVERRLASATAAMFFGQPFNESAEGGMIPRTTPSTLGEARGLCEDEPFVEQPSISACTAFLVGEDLVLTAGHCVANRTCSDLSFAFDYAYFDAAEVGSVPAIPTANYFQCAEIVEAHTVACEDDWALIRLDRPSEREPLEYRREGGPTVDAPLLAAGFPLAIPMKIAGSARIRSIDELKLHTDLDIFGGNSGSPVIDARTGVIEGIHVCSEAGNTMPDPAGRSCKVALDCGFEGESCSRWAEATRITRLAQVVDEARGIIGPVPGPSDAGVDGDAGVDDDADAGI